MKVFWWQQQPGNFGDELAPLLMEKLFGIKAEWSNAPGKLLTIGSILGYAKIGDTVWGSGAGSPVLTQIKLTAKAVRGPLTREAMLRAGIACPMVYGDPGLLLDRLFSPSSSQQGVGVVPHCSEVELIRNRFPDSKIISPLLSPEQFVQELSRCSTILSSSLHGLVAADVYQIPSAYVRFVVKDEREYQTRLTGRFKFDDYYLGTGREPQVPRYLFNQCDLKTAVLKAKYLKVKFNHQALLDAF